MISARRILKFDKLKPTMNHWMERKKGKNVYIYIELEIHTYIKTSETIQTPYNYNSDLIELKSTQLGK